MDDGPWEPPRLRAVPPMDHTAGHKPSQYQPRFGEVICARLQAGETVRQITADPAMPSYATVFRWLKVNPDFSAMYESLRADLAAWRVERRALRKEAETWRAAHEARLGMRKAPRHWVSRKSSFTRAWAARFCAAIELGATVAQACAAPGMPSVKQVHTWLKTKAEFREMYGQAKWAQRQRLEMRIEDIVDGVDPSNLAEAKREVAYLEGRIGRLTPKTYRPTRRTG